MSIKDIVSKISKVDLILIAGDHILRFKKLIDRAREGIPGIRANECEYYLNMWTNILNKLNNNDYDSKVLSTDEFYEIYSAVSSGDYDDLIGEIA